MKRHTKKKTDYSEIKAQGNQHPFVDVGQDAKSMKRQRRAVE